MSDICLGIRTRLIGRSTVLAALSSTGSKIYPDVLPQSPSYPCATITVISGDSDFDLDGGSGVATQRVSITAFATTRTAANALATAIHRELHGFKGAAGDERILSSLCVGRNNVTEPPEEGSGQWRYLTVYDYEVMHSEAVHAA